MANNQPQPEPERCETCGETEGVWWDDGGGGEHALGQFICPACWKAIGEGTLKQSCDCAKRSYIGQNGWVNFACDHCV